MRVDRVPGGDAMATIWIRSEADRLRDVIVSHPLSSYGEVDLLAHNWHSHPDLVRAAWEHGTLVEVIRGEGVRVHAVSGDPSLPNHIYPRDAAFVGPRGAWLSRFGLASRQGEVPRIRDALEAAGVPIV